ncbi:MAG: transcriptional regulator [Saprospiraceae bacterium]
MLIINNQEWISFKNPMNILNVSYGKLATQLKKLEEANYIEVKKEFLNKKTNTI